MPRARYAWCASEARWCPEASTVTSCLCGAKGDGPAAARLRPLGQTLAAIDGHRPVRAHGNAAMPVWGQIFERKIEEQKIGWPKATTLQRERLIAAYVLTLQP
jgi:hypothetical protein